MQKGEKICPRSQASFILKKSVEYTPHPRQFRTLLAWPPERGSSDLLEGSTLAFSKGVHLHRS